MNPELGRPGAGLPFLEKLLGRYWYMPRDSRQRSDADLQQIFASNGRRALDAARALSTEDLHRRVLIDRFQGIEDSSRYWSVAMTLDHLIIVGEKIAEMMIRLSRGETVTEEVDIAKVKPPVPEAPTREILDRFEQFLSAVPDRLEREWKKRDSAHAHRHPWFGRLTAHQWHWILAVHQRTHRAQTQKIIAGLVSQSSSS